MNRPTALAVLFKGGKRDETVYMRGAPRRLIRSWLMRQVVLASHHRFAQGLADTLEFLGAKCNFRVVCAYVDEQPLEPQVKEIFDGFGAEDEVLVLTDILAGSVNQKFLPYVAPNVFVVAGVNVVLAMELCLAPAPLTAEGIQEAIDVAGQSIKLINTIQIEDDEDDE